jgi:glycosyltransferase involved in cell wall biosynthesis
LIAQFPVPEPNCNGWPWTEETGKRPYDSSFRWPKISIVTPSFNQGKFIEETIRSVLLQNYPNLEYIIIDGGSSDETIDIIKKYKRWITFWVSEPDRGQSDAINKGLEKCTGDLFNWLNSDDWYTAGALFEIATAFMNHPTAEVVSGLENHVGLDGQITLHYGSFLKEKLEETIEFCQVTQPSTFFKLSTVKETGGVSEDLHYIMDGEMWLKILLLKGQESFVKIEKVLVNFRLHENSKTVSNSIINNFLIERASIILNLQKMVTVPTKVIDYYLHTVYGNPPIINLNRAWQFNDGIISKRKLRVFFIQKYVTAQFRLKNFRQACWGIRELIKNGALGFFLLKSTIKLLLKR